MIYKESQNNVIRTFNLGLLVSTLCVFTMGIFTLFSATKGLGVQVLYKSQLIYFGVGSVVCLLLIFADLEIFEKLAYVGYVVCLFLLALVLVIGKVGGGSQRWIGLGPIHIQPSEFAKLAIIFTLAKYFANEKGGAPYTLRRLWLAALLVGPLYLLILVQPDFGTAMILFLVSGTIVLFLGLHWKSILTLVVAALITIPVTYKYVLKDYQRNRVHNFLDPQRDPQGTGYNALQCRIAVGSGQILGKGFLKGTQAQLNFIPEQHTDFIFSVFSEERGFFGCMVLLVCYFSYLYFSLRTVQRARDKFQMLLAVGLTALMFWHVFFNIGMVSGVLPIVGVTLPFFSYGGSSLITFLISTAFLLNISRKRYIF